MNDFLKELTKLSKKYGYYLRGEGEKLIIIKIKNNTVEYINNKQIVIIGKDYELI